MKFKKLLLIGMSSLLLASCDLMDLLGMNAEGETDVNLYHLKLSANLNTVSQDDLKATYAYGTAPSQTVVEGHRDEDDIQALLDAGAKQSDIVKAGRRQEDGSYYFFDQDPMYLEAPKVEGYRTPVFYNKANSQDLYSIGLQRVEDVMALAYYNMPGKDTELEARYEPIAYEVSWQNYPAEVAQRYGYSNPNTQITNYNYATKKDVTLQPATFTNEHVHFVGWEYQDGSQLDEHGYAKWVLCENNKLPIDYDEPILRIQPRIEMDMYKISFDFKTDSGTQLSYSEVMEGTMQLHAHLMTVNEAAIESQTSTDYFDVDLTKEYKIDCVDGAAVFFYTLKSTYVIDRLEVNGVKNDAINSYHMNQVSIRNGDITTDSVITFVVTANIN